MPSAHPSSAGADRSRSRSRALEHLGAALEGAGMPRMPARVWAALLSDEDGRMTAQELSETLAVSPAAISGAVRWLAQVGLIRRERDPGTRRDVYVALDEMWHDLLLRADQTYRPIIRALEEGIPAHGSRSGAGRRLVVSREFLEFVAEEMQDMAVRWEARRARAEENRR